MEKPTLTGNYEKDVDLLEMFFRSLVDAGEVHEDTLFIDLRIIMNNLYPVFSYSEDDDMFFPSELLTYVKSKIQFIQDLESSIDYLLDESYFKTEEVQNMVISERPYRKRYP